MRADYQNRNESITTNQETRPRSRWPGRVGFLFVIAVTFAMISMVIPVNWAGAFVLGLVFGFCIRNVE